MPIIYFDDDSESLMHYGVKGMKWGVRRSPEQLGHKIINKHRDRKEAKVARKDAKEFARAKMFYGEGAGNRRKLIKATVQERSKKSSVYKNEFERALAGQDMAKHAAKAKKERRVKDAKNTVGKFGRGAINIATGNPQRAAASVIGVYGLLHITGTDKKLIDTGKKFVHKHIRQ